MTIRSRIRAALSLRDSPIGRGVPRWLGALLAAVALAAVAIDLGASPWFIDYDEVQAAKRPMDRRTGEAGADRAGARGGRRDGGRAAEAP